MFRFPVWTASLLLPALLAGPAAQAAGPVHELHASLAAERSPGTPARTASASVEQALALELAKRLPPSLKSSAGVQLKPVADLSTSAGHRTLIPVDTVQAFAILPSGTNITQPDHLAGRTVCLSGGGSYAGLLQARFGAVEKRHASLSDALAALRGGSCDAVVDNSLVLQQLIRLPEWKSHSAHFPVGDARSLALVVPASQSHAVPDVKQALNDWQASGQSEAVARQFARELSASIGIRQN